MKEITDSTTKALNSFKGYIPMLDSVQTGITFLQATGAQSENAQLHKNAVEQIKKLQLKIQAATDIKAFIRKRKQELMGQFEQLGMGKELKELSKQAYYYQQQLNQYETT